MGDGKVMAEDRARGIKKAESKKSNVMILFCFRTDLSRSYHTHTHFRRIILLTQTTSLLSFVGKYDSEKAREASGIDG